MNLWEEGNHAVTYTNLSILRVKEESSTSTSWDSFTYKILWYKVKVWDIMKPIDMMVTDYNCEYLGLSRLCLMESAGKSLAEEVGKIAVYTFSKPVKVVIFTGSGGNGGDGFVAARYLLNRGYDVDIYMLKDNIHSEEAKTNFEILKNMKPRLSCICKVCFLLICHLSSSFNPPCFQVLLHYATLR